MSTITAGMKRMSASVGLRNFDQSKEDQAIKNGNLKAARTWDARRRQKQKETKASKNDLLADKAGLHKD
jgi:hypothetical protein